MADTSIPEETMLENNLREAVKVEWETLYPNRPMTDADHFALINVIHKLSEDKNFTLLATWYAVLHFLRAQGGAEP